MATVMDDAQMKLREADFFRRQLAQESNKIGAYDPETFAYYLSAFLSAGASVTDVLQQRGKGKLVKAWKNNCTDEERALLADFIIRRNKEVHRRGVTVHEVAERIPIIEVRAANLGEDHFYSFHLSGVPGTPPPLVRRTAHYFDTPRGRKEITPLCDQYVDLLGRLVRELETKQPPAKAGGFWVAD